MKCRVSRFSVLAVTCSSRGRVIGIGLRRGQSIAVPKVRMGDRNVFEMFLQNPMRLDIQLRLEGEITSIHERDQPTARY